MRLRDAVAGELRALSAALTFMTRLPLGWLAQHSPALLPASVAYFPIVGLAVAACAAATFALASRVWSGTLSVLVSILATILATGAFHEDAFADSADAFGGAWTPQRVLEIMKDSRVGSYAVVGLWMVLTIKFAALVELAARGGPREITHGLIAGHVLGRWSSVPLMWRYPYVRTPTADDARASAGAPFTHGVSTMRLVAATGFAIVIVSVSLERTTMLMAGVVAIAVTIGAGIYFRRRIGGITGDALGAANQVVELCVYLAMLAVA